MKKQLDETRAIDDRRFEIQLKKPFPHLLYGLGRAADCVVRPERVAGHVDAPFLGQVLDSAQPPPAAQARFSRPSPHAPMG